ncbi:MAG: hydrolase [Planctomycetota bacterium]|nr:MAG: hydrolase [Planctomycetota bacterium]
MVLWLSGCAAGAYTPGLRRPPLAEPGVRHGEGRLRMPDGVELFHQAWRPVRGPVRGTVLIVHGLKDHSSRYHRFACQLARRGYLVRAFDLRGHGDSSGDRVWVDCFDVYLEDLERYLAAHPEGLPRPLFLLGHSMGGAIVTLWAIRRQPELAGLILSAPALVPGENVSGFLIAIAKVLSALCPTLAVMELRDEDFSRDPSTVQAIKTDPLIEHGKGPARTGAEVLRALGQISAAMERVRVPLLILHGTEDRLTNPAGSRQLHERAASEDKTLVLLEGLYHDLLHEPEHAEIEARIIAWIEARTPSPDPSRVAAQPAAR